jgi:uncharacterized membrane protein (UPF0127 family)
VGRNSGRYALAALIACGTLLAAVPPPARATELREPLARFPTGEVTVDSLSSRHVFKVWVADTEPHRSQGLMWTKSLPSDHGMLFLFDPPQTVSFWMKNTLIPLDLLFVAPDGRVIRIAERARPLSLAKIDSLGIVRGVLELAGGTSARLGIKPGDRLHHPAFAAH